MRTALIQIALDAHVGAMAPAPNVKPTGDMYPLNVFIGDRWQRIILASESGPGREGLVITRADSRAEPAATTARTVWARRDLLVDPAVRLSILSRLDSTTRGLSLSTLASEVAREDAMDIVLALVATGSCWMRLTYGLHPETIIRRRRLPILLSAKPESILTKGTARVRLPTE